MCPDEPVPTTPRIPGRRPRTGRAEPAAAARNLRTSSAASTTRSRKIDAQRPEVLIEPCWFSPPVRRGGVSGQPPFQVPRQLSLTDSADPIEGQHVPPCSFAKRAAPPAHVPHRDRARAKVSCSRPRSVKRSLADTQDRRHDQKISHHTSLSGAEEETALAAQRSKRSPQLSAEDGRSSAVPKIGKRGRQTGKVAVKLAARSDTHSGTVAIPRRPGARST